MKKSVLFIFLSFRILNILGQSDNDIEYPEVGHRCPDLLLTNIHYYTKNQVTIPDSDGQWTVLDFWSRTCSGCIESFPKYSRLQQLYKGKVNFFLVGFEDKANAIQPLYETFQKRLNLQMPVAFDSTIFSRLDIGAVPYVIFIDPKGIVRGITSYFTNDQFSKIIAGEKVELTSARRTHQEHPMYDPNESYLVNGNGGNDSTYLYRSILAKWDQSMPYFNAGSISYNIKKGKFDALGIGLLQLYRYAYRGNAFVDFQDTSYGKLSGDLVLETHDSLKFKENMPLSTSSFSYSLSVPASLSSPKYLMQVMQRDLKTYFGYDVEIQTRAIPAWKLVAINDAKKELITKGGPAEDKSIISPNQEYLIRNLPISRLLRKIWYEHQHEGLFVDETGIQGNIDIDIKMYVYDLDDVKKALRKHGLDLIKGEVEIKAIVIKDPLNN